jgi:hypothetical protein
MYGPHGNVSEYGSQRYIALADGFGLQNNYTSDEFMDNLNPVMAPNTLPQSQPDRIQGVPISLP